MYKRGDKVRIKSCPIKEDLVGAKAEIVRVRHDGEKAFYKVRVGNFYVPNYALDEHLSPL